MSIGFHVSKVDKLTLTQSIKYFQDEYKGMECCQIFTYGPKTQNKNNYDEKELMQLCKSTNIYIHSTYMSSFKFWPHIIEQLKNADELGVKGVVFHIPKEMPDKIAHYTEVMCKHFTNTKLIWEMKALKCADDSYESPEKLIALVDEFKKAGIKHKQVGICIDTAHISSGQADIKTKKAAQAYVEKLEPIKKWITLLHLNGNEYDGKIRAGDKHTCPMSKDDKVWPDMILKDSGCLVFYKWFMKNKLDVILEIEVDEESLNLFQALKNC